MIKITFAWDDGAPEDLKLVDLCTKFKIPGIFFIPSKNPERSVLKHEEIMMISSFEHEIGSHTYSHCYLTGVSFDEAESELKNGKDFLEQLLGRQIDHFCFPGGRYNRTLTGLAQKYFKTARTADTGAVLKNDSFLIKPTIHFFDRGLYSLLYNSLKNHSSVVFSVIKNFYVKDYFCLIRKLIYDMEKSNGEMNIIIWGHSWEIEQSDLWDTLEDFFRLLNSDYSHTLMRYSDIIKSVQDKSVSFV